MRRPNFTAGPCALPDPVVAQLREDVWELEGEGAGVLEISHRSPRADRIFEEAEARLRRVLSVPDRFAVLWLQGGASAQFGQVPLNFLPAGARAGYAVHGVWGEKALAEARRVGDAVCVSTSEATRFDRCPAPATWAVPDGLAYLHYTSNNTIYGTQLHATPAAAAPLVCDMSSDFLTRPVAWDAHALVYAGAQKNLGPAGVTAVLVDRRWADEGGRRDLPRFLEYRTHIAGGSRWNTPPVFAVHAANLNLAWIESEGGLPAMAARAQARAARVYAALDAHLDVYEPHARPDSRSVMNLTFRLRAPGAEAAWLAEADRRGLIGLAGHRSVGGVRASLYNAATDAWVDALVELIEDHARAPRT